MAGIKELTSEIDRSQVAGIGCGGQMHGLVTLDAEDHVIRPAILWNDGRTGAETEYLNTVIGKDKLSQYTANIAFAGFTAPKILWMKKKRAGEFRKSKEDHASQGLSGILHDRFLLHRSLRRFRYASSGCEEPLLVKGNAGNLRHYGRTASEAL